MTVWQFLNDNFGLIVFLVIFGGGALVIGLFEIVFGNLAKAFQALGGSHRLRRRVRDLEDELDDVWAARRADGDALRQWVTLVNAQLATLNATALPPTPDLLLDDWPQRDRADRAEDAAPRRRGKHVQAPESK